MGNDKLNYKEFKEMMTKKETKTTKLTKQASDPKLMDKDGAQS